jgi:hypothetical protein
VWKNYFCQLLNVQGAGGVRQTEIHTAEPLVPEPSASEVEVAVRKFERYKSPGVDQILVELIQALGGWGGGWILRYINLLCWPGKKEELPHQWKESIVIPVHKKGDKIDCSKWGISLRSASYKILSNILLSRLISYADEITGNHQCILWCSRSTTDQIFYICQVLEKKWEYNGTVHRLFIDFKKAYDSVRR